jgi:ectoine hydroxylase-related dioxygenase (phytanoyl-CoA dioxygenase family)
VDGAVFPVVQCTVEEGDVVLMDSRLLHCGGGNRSAERRRLVYFSLHVPGNLPQGSTYSMRGEYRGAPRRRLGRHSKLPFVVPVPHAAEITHILNLVLVHENGTSKHDGKGPSLV